MVLQTISYPNKYFNYVCFPELYQISLSGNYLRSCFGMTLNELVRHLNPVRMSPISNVKTASEVQDAVLSIPKEIWRMVDFLYKKGMDTVQYFAIIDVKFSGKPIFGIRSGRRNGSYSRMLGHWRRLYTSQ